MNAPLGTKNRPWKARISLINGDTAAIAVGQPVCFKVTDLGAVVLPATAGAAMTHPLFAGVAATAAAVGQPVEVICGGYVNTAKFRLRTRAASTDDYSSMAASLMSYGCYLSIDTVNNCFAYSTVGAATLVGPQAVLLETYASISSVASTTSITHTISSTNTKVWIRALT